MGKVLGAYLMPHPPIIIPEIGRGEESKITDTLKAMDKIACDVAEKRPDTIIIISPHGTLFRDAISIMGTPRLKGDFGQFRAKNIIIEKENDIELAREIDGEAWSKGIPTVLMDKERLNEYGMEGNLDHGALVPLYFIEKEYKQYKLVHLTYGLLSKSELYDFGKVLSSCIEKSDRNIVLIASGDLSHKLTKDAPAGYHPSGKIFDEILIDLLGKGDVEGIFSIDTSLTNSAGECGLRSIEILLGAFDGFEISAEVLSYEGPFGVGYGTVKIDAGEKSSERVFDVAELETRKIKRIREKEDEYVQLARQSLESYVMYRDKIKVPANINKELKNNRAGVFVSIKKDGELRGCIGTIQPTEDSIAEEIIRNAIQSGTQDPRFYPVEKDELEKLVYSVDVLGKPEPIEDISQLDVKVYGVIVESGYKKGLLLPDLEGVDSVEEQLRIALQKANISKGEKYKMYRFKVERH